MCRQQFDVFAFEVHIAPGRGKVRALDAHVATRVNGHSTATDAGPLLPRCLGDVGVLLIL